jgi:hypothetical protein
VMSSLRCGHHAKMEVLLWSWPSGRPGPWKTQNEYAKLEQVQLPVTLN